MTKYPIAAVLVLAWMAVAPAPSVHAAVGWISVANSPGHEKLDWAAGPNKASATASRCRTAPQWNTRATAASSLPAPTA
jgi:hypothetical protein